jgi:hypothetical protein
MDTENRNPASEATWELWYQDLFDRECPRKVEMSGTGLVQGLAETWARHLFETVQADGQKGFSHFNLWWLQKQKSIEIIGNWEGMVRLRRWVFGSQRTANRDYLGDGDQALLMEIALAHCYMLLSGKSSEAILKLAQKCANRDDFLKQLADLG